MFRGILATSYFREAGNTVYPVPGEGTFPASLNLASYGLTGGSLGTPFDPGSSSAPSNMTTGLSTRIIDGIWTADGNPSNINFGFFNAEGINGVDIYGGFGYMFLDSENYGMSFTGYFKVTETASYNLVLDSDDVMIAWVGSAALNPSSSNYSTLSNNSSAISSNSHQLAANLWYPIRIWFQEWSGAERGQFFIGKTTDTDYVNFVNIEKVHNSATDGI